MSCLPKKALVLEVKQGDSLVFGCTAEDAEGSPVSLVGVTVKAQMRALDDENTLIDEFVFAPIDLSIGTYELAYSGDSRVTAPPSDYAVDIEYSAPDGARLIARSSRTFFVRVLRGVTTEVSP